MTQNQRPMVLGLAAPEPAPPSCFLGMTLIPPSRRLEPSRGYSRPPVRGWRREENACKPLAGSRGERIICGLIFAEREVDACHRYILAAPGVAAAARGDHARDQSDDVTRLNKLQEERKPEAKTEFPKDAGGDLEAAGTGDRASSNQIGRGQALIKHYFKKVW